MIIYPFLICKKDIEDKEKGPMAVNPFCAFKAYLRTQEHFPSKVMAQASSELICCSERKCLPCEEIFGS
jgi:hypothetical protein